MPFDVPFNLLDALLAVVFLLSLWRGWATGFVAGVVLLAGLLGGVAVAAWGSAYVGTALDRLGWLAQPWASPAAFLMIFVVAQLLLFGLVQAVPRPRRGGGAAQAANRAFGLLPGAANGLINTLVLSVLATGLPIDARLDRLAQESVLVDALATPADWLEQRLAPVFQPAVDRTLQALTPAAEPHQRLSLPFKVTTAPARPELEAAMLVLVNAEREQAGLRPLAADPGTVDVSRAHARDMFARGYFAHETPEGATPFDRLRAAGIRFRAAGENLALAPTLQRAHDGLMKSPGHRANILQPAFGRLGIGIVDGGRRGLMVTQTFRN